MLRIAMIGAGSIGFTRRLMMDILAVEELRDTEFRFMDIDPQNLEMAATLCRKMIAQNGLAATVITTADRREAIRGADYVFCFARVGGLQGLINDVEIPLKYGVDQCVGDTLGPGGVFYGLRTIPLLLDIAAEMRELAPEALLLNYANPMAINVLALNRAGGVKAVGLCHGVQHSTSQLARVLGVPRGELDVTAAGINHQTWFVQVSHKGKDLLPHVREAYERDPWCQKWEKVRTDVIRRFGYYCTESSGHTSEYLPWYRKRREELDRWTCPEEAFLGGMTAGYLQWLRSQAGEYKEMYPKWLDGTADTIQLGDRSVEHGSYIIEALETGRPYRGHFNIENRGHITNLPDGAVIEIPCYVDRHGITPGFQGKLPLQCAATCRASISVQEMAVEAALTGDRELVKLAVLHDPLTAAVCTTEQVWQMCDELFEANARWMPQFNGEGRRWSDIPAPRLQAPFFNAR